MLEKGIYIESKPAPGATRHGRRHLYLVYRDGEGGERVIRGGPEGHFLVGGNIEMQVDLPLSESKDVYEGNATSNSRRARLLDLDGMDPEIVWRQMTAAAEQVAARGIDYDAAPMQNSNSTIRHVIEAAGLDPAKAFPKDYSPAKHPGYANDLNDPNDRTGITRGQLRDIATMLMGGPDADAAARRLDPPDPAPDYAAKRVDDGTRGWAEPKEPPPKPNAPDDGTRGPAASESLGRRVRDLMKSIPSLQKTLLKNPADWTDAERRAVMGDVAYLNPAHPDHQRAHDGTAGFYAAIYGTEPSKTDASGKTIEPAPKRPVRPEPAPIMTVEGEELERAADNLADALDAAGRTQGPTEAVRRLQKGVNRLVDRDAPAPTPPRDPARFYAEAAERAAPRPARLKEDGIFGPKTADATAKALVRFGRRPVEAPLLAEASHRAAPTRRKPEDDRPVFRA